MNKSTLSALFVFSFLGACTPNKNESNQSVQKISAGPPTTQLTRVSVNGLRGDFLITKTQNTYTVVDTTGVVAPQEFNLISHIQFIDMTVNLEIGKKAESISNANLQAIIELYIAYFNRVPDAEGLAYWIEQNKNGASLTSIADNFYNAAIYHASLTGYSSSMNSSDFIIYIYSNVLGRKDATAPNLGEINYWDDELSSGRQTHGSLVLSMLTAAHSFKSDKQWGWVADLLDNKVKVANLFAVQQGLNFNSDEDSIVKTMRIAKAITPTSTAAAVTLMGRVDWGFREFEGTGINIAPIPVLNTSYANKNRFEITDTIMPNAYLMGIDSPTTTGAYFHNRPFGIADFTQEGKFSVMVFQAQFSSLETKKTGFSNLPAKAYFIQRNASGNYIDITSQLIKREEDRYTCATPTYALIADFNHDEKPDVFVACSGPDYQVNGVWLDSRTEQIAFMSQQDGTYKRWQSSFKSGTHQCSAGDINGDKNIDVVCTDPGKNPFTLLGDGKGDFVRDDTRFPNYEGKAVGGIELVDTNNTGILDVFLGAVTQNADTWPPGQYNNVFIKNNGSGFFNINTPQILPTSLAPKMVSQGKNFNYSALHDVIVSNGYAYILQYDYLYTSMAIRRINMSNFLDHQIIYENITGFSNNGYVPLMKPTADGYLIPIMICDFLKTDPVFQTTACGVKAKM